MRLFRTIAFAGVIVGSLAVMFRCSSTVRSSGTDEDSGTDAGYEAAPIECSSDTDCTPEVPVCDSASGTCRACSMDSECTAAGFSRCVSGACVECTSAADCQAPAAFCGTDNECRGCIAHQECTSLACDIGTGICAPEENVVYALAETGVSGTCGTFAEPCWSIQAAADQLTVTRSYLVLIATNAKFTQGATLPSVDGITVIGNAVAVVPNQRDFGFKVTGGSATFEGVSIAAADLVSSDPAIPDGAGILCTGGSITVRASAFSGSRRGVAADACNVEVTTSHLLNNYIGVSSNGSTGGYRLTLDVNRSKFETNVFAVDAYSVAAAVTNNLFLRNGSNDYTRVIDFNDTLDPSLFAYNTLIENVNNCVYIGIVACAGSANTYSPPLITSNLSYNNFPGADPMCASQVYLCDEGVMSNNLAETVYPGSGNSAEDPMLTDPVNGDYRPGDGSPAIDNGNPDYAPAADFDGTARPLGNGPDIGAYEVK